MPINPRNLATDVANRPHVSGSRSIYGRIATRNFTYKLFLIRKSSLTENRVIQEAIYRFL